MRCLIPQTGTLWLLFFSAIWLQTSERTFGGQNQPVQDFPRATNIYQLHQMVSGNMGAICAFCLEGTVLAANPDSGMIAFQDNSGTEILEINVKGPSLKAGLRIRLEGTNYVTLTETGLSLGKCPVINNDGRHWAAECTATLYLKTGLYPITLSWFNYTAQFSLDFTYSGPNFTRQKIPDSVLFRSEPSLNGKTSFAGGLNYRCFEGQSENLPEFDNLQPVKQGVISNFNLNVRTRDEHVALIFDGLLKVDSDGIYTFYLASDDGSQFFIHNTPIRLTVTGTNNLPIPIPIAIRQPLPKKSTAFWAEIEGNVTFLGKRPYGTQLEITSDGSHMRLLVCDAPEEPPSYLLGSLVRVRGVCLDTSSTAGHKLANTMVIPNLNSFHVLEVPPEFWSFGQHLTIGQCQQTNKQGAIVCFRGRFNPRPLGQLPELEDGTGSVQVELLNSTSTGFNSEVECLGRWSQSGSNSILYAAFWRKSSIDSSPETNALTLLTTAAQVEELTSKEAERGYPVKLRGVVTWVSGTRDCMVLQDSTHGVFVILRPAWILESPVIGNNFEIEGTSAAGAFAPVVNLTKATKLGRGILPDPINPTWDQLIGGSLDSQYVEIRGLVTHVNDNQMTLLLPDGNINVEFYPIPGGSLEPYLNSIIRIRCCVFAKWDPNTLQVTPENPLWLGDATICVDELPSSNVFDAPRIRAKELMTYDVQRNFFRRVKVYGQFLQSHSDIYYMTENGFGVRFQPIVPVHLAPGDTIEAVGLVELGGASPVLRQAVVRKVGHLPLPMPIEFRFNSTNELRDSTRVSVKAILAGLNQSGEGQELQMRAGLNSFVAWLPIKDETTVPWPIGGLLKLTGIYSDVKNAPPMGNVNPFEILLNSPTDVELIARPPWWTLNRLLAMVALLAMALALAFVWIRLLRRQVEHRTAQLQHEILTREQVEKNHAIAQERSRIAHDIHDQLGAELAQISLLADVGTDPDVSPIETNQNFNRIAQRARTSVSTLDEIVWAVDPRNDNLTRLADYLCQVADECFDGTQIRLRKEVPMQLPPIFIRAEVRHNLTLAVKEAFTNLLKHSQASEVWLKLSWVEPNVMISVEDNGCGFDVAAASRGNGLDNQQARLEGVGGAVQLHSAPGNGTKIAFRIKLETKID